MDCENTGILDSCHSLRPTNSGEFAAIATCAPAIACEAFHASANLFGATCRCSCIDVHEDSGAISANSAAYRSSRPSSICTYSPRASTIELLSAS